MVGTDNIYCFWVYLEFFFFFTLLVLRESKSSVMYFTFQARAGLFLIGGLALARYGLFQAGILVKLGLFPFHHWVMGVLSRNNLAVIFVLLFPAKYPLYTFVEGTVILVRAVATMAVGAVLALGQSEVMPTLIYSRITSTGILVAGFNYNVFDLYFTLYAGSFGLVLLLLHWNSPLVPGGLLNLIGFPPLPIFFAKLALLARVIEAVPLLVALVVVFFLSVLYYVKLLK